MTAAQGPDARTASTPQPARSAAPAGGAPRPVGSAPSDPTTTSRSVSGPQRPTPRPAVSRPDEGPARPPAKARKARLALKRIDPWSVFVFSLIAALLLGIALVAAVAALYAVLDGLGVQSSVNQLFAEVVGAGGPLLTARRVIGGAAVLAALNVVLLTLLATLGALLYNLCASFTGGLELTLGERDG